MNGNLALKQEANNQIPKVAIAAFQIRQIMNICFLDLLPSFDIILSNYGTILSKAMLITFLFRFFEKFKADFHLKDNLKCDRSKTLIYSEQK